MTNYFVHARSAAALGIILVVIGMAGCSGCKRTGGGPPPPATTATPQIVSAFYTGLLAMATADLEGRAERNFKLVTQLAPTEPAGWADLALFQLRNNNLVDAEKNLNEAHKLAPDDPTIEAIFGLLEKGKGNFSEAVRHLKRSADLNPKDLKARFALVDAIRQNGGANADADAQTQVQGVYDLVPANLYVQTELAQIAAKSGNTDLLHKMVAQIVSEVAVFAPAKEYLAKLQADASGGNLRPVVTDISILRNVCLTFPRFTADRDAVNPTQTLAGTPLERFLVLPNPSSSPAAPDLALNFVQQAIPRADTPGNWNLIRTFVPTPELRGESEMAAGRPASPEGPPSVLLANGSEVRVISDAGAPAVYPYPGGNAKVKPTNDGVLVVDFDNDFRPDLVLAGAGGLRLMKGSGKGTFTDVTAAAKLPAAITGGSYTGAWAADLESDGDLDLVLANTTGEPTVLQNNGDGTWKVVHPFTGLAGGVSAFAWVDLDGDGLDDAAFVDNAGALHVYGNARGGSFVAWPAPAIGGKVVALSVADANRDGALDLVVLGSDGAVSRVSRKADGGWEIAALLNGVALPSDGSARLIWTDLDDNGGRDLLVTSSSSSQIWLCDDKGTLQPLAAPVGGRSLCVADPQEGKRLDLVGFSTTGVPARFANAGVKDYRWLDIRPRDRGAHDKRINSFAIGGEIEVRAGLLYAKVPMDGPAVRVGLGQYTQADSLRLDWPNGALQAEFELKSNQPFESLQRLTSSCPWLFAWDGTAMKLVTDCIWRSPLGLKINAQDTAGVSQTEDWVKIRGDQLVPHDGYYDLRISAELWETHFFDHLSLMTVDHPAGTEIFIDERFAIPPPPLKVNPAGPVHPIAKAMDDLGHDVTDVLQARDGKYLGSFGRGYYQGVTRDHFVELTLGDDAPKAGPLWLVANGWIHPTDSSINVALGQGHREQPKGLSLEVPDGHGAWAVARPGLGFPEGKIKTVLIDLTGVFKPGTPRKMRLRTNLEIYWDSIGYAAGLPTTPLKIQRLTTSGADLHHRGYSVTHQADATSPEMPDYTKLAGTAPKWRDLEGFYTRYGDVQPLLTKIDDRYVIMNSGDELALRFPAQPNPPAGWVRDYVLVGDGWVKDGNFNTTWSRTVAPLPAHDIANYPAPPGSLLDDPVYKRHPEDWVTYHTRYIDSRPARNAMIPRE